MTRNPLDEDAMWTPEMEREHDALTGARNSTADHVHKADAFDVVMKARAEERRAALIEAAEMVEAMAAKAWNHNPDAAEVGEDIAADIRAMAEGK